jgi:guanylate kinase
MGRIVLCGKAASGKDHMRKVLESRGFRYGVSYATRVPRPGEVEGRDYYFITTEEFKGLMEDGFWYEWDEFNGAYYGTSKLQFHEECDLFIMTPAGVAKIHPEDRKQTTVIYLDIAYDVRNERLHKRNMPGDTAERRIQADEESFKHFTDFDIRITNPDF